MKHVTEQYFDQMLETLQKLLRIDTVKSEAEPGAPFGRGNAECLKLALNIAEELGFETVNCDNYAGHADFGQGGETVGILGHLDVVPADGAWTAGPFDAKIVDGYLYGRGTLDDKGPMVACLYAMKALKDSGFKPKKKIRFILGCDEESGWACMDYYKTKFPMPETGFSPDGNFPLINREKGLYHFTLNLGKVNENIASFTSGSRVNVVPDSAAAEIKNTKFDRAAVGKCGVKIKEENGIITLSAEGVSCHGSTPEKGDNAAWKIFKALQIIFPSDKAISFAADKLCRDFNGQAWGIPFTDAPSGKITHNIGKVRLEKDGLCLGIDIRYPVTFTEEQIVDALKANSYGSIIKLHSHASLFVPEDSELVQKLLKAYADVTGNDAYTIALGGATYARCLPQGVAFGPAFPGEDKNIHCIDEKVSLDVLKQLLKIYYEAIKALAS